MTSLVSALEALTLSILLEVLWYHARLNILAELLRFGDREFYKDWWNAKTVEEVCLWHLQLVFRWSDFLQLIYNSRSFVPSFFAYAADISIGGCGIWYILLHMLIYFYYYQWCMCIWYCGGKLRFYNFVNYQLFGRFFTYYFGILVNGMKFEHYSWKSTLFHCIVSLGHLKIYFTSYLVSCN